jgi:hypothetical protein
LHVCRFGNRNLVTNGGAEDPQVKDIPGWIVTGGFSVAAYDESNLLRSTGYGPVPDDINVAGGLLLPKTRQARIMIDLAV